MQGAGWPAAALWSWGAVLGSQLPALPFCPLGFPPSRGHFLRVIRRKICLAEFPHYIPFDGIRCTSPRNKPLSPGERAQA